MGVDRAYWDLNREGHGGLWAQGLTIISEEKREDASQTTLENFCNCPKGLGLVIVNNHFKYLFVLNRSYVGPKLNL